MFAPEVEMWNFSFYKFLRILSRSGNVDGLANWNKIFRPRDNCSFRM